MNSIASTLLARLEGVRRTGEGRWHARCPAHDDKSPSLTISERDDKVLIHCFAGCDPDDVLAAVGLQWKDLYPDPWDCAAKRPIPAVARYAKKVFESEPLDVERWVVKIAAADRAAGRPESQEDMARLQVAIERLAAAQGRAA